jgi:hypothetical protein
VLHLLKFRIAVKDRLLPAVLLAMTEALVKQAWSAFLTGREVIARGLERKRLGEAFVSRHDCDVEAWLLPREGGLSHDRE